MTLLRRRMIDDMTLRNFTKATIQAYVRCVARFALHFHASPDLLGPEHVRSYLLHLLQEQYVSHSYSKLNTVQRIITTVSAKVFFKGGRCRCSGRFFFHFDIFCLITRGLIRLRRGSVRSSCISQSKPRYHAS